MDIQPVYSHFEPEFHSAITRVHVENQGLPLVDRIIEPQTIANFLSFACSGTLPNGKTTTLEILKESEIPLINKSPSPQNDPRDIMTRVMTRIGSTEDEMRMTLIGRNIWSVKNRVWAGIAPMSEQRWIEKGLDHPDNFDVAIQYLAGVVAAFEYLNQTQVRGNMRTTFNLISGHWGEFEGVVNLSREGQTRLDMRKLWTVYIEALFEVITKQAHHWVISKINQLREPLLRQLSEHHPPNLDSPDSLQWKITDRLHALLEVASVADFSIMLPMDGYHGYTAPPTRPAIPAGLQSPDWHERRAAYSPYLKRESDVMQFQDIMGGISQNRPRHRVADPISLTRTCMVQITCQDRIRDHMRGFPENASRTGLLELWIADKLNRQSNEDGIKDSGFVVYRLTYDQSEDEWAAFRNKVDAHISNWGEPAYEGIKAHLKLHWRDGQALGIPEGDVEAATRHYNETYSNSPDLPFTYDDMVNKQAFFIIDGPSYASYVTPSYSASTSNLLPGDFTGFLLAIDPEYDEAEGPSRPDETPGFQGQMRILGSLIWSDLYAMLVSQCAILEDLWPLVLEHPNFVYTGLTVPLQLQAWREHHVTRGVLMREVTDYAKAKVHGKPWPANSQSSQPAPAPTQALTPSPNQQTPPRNQANRPNPFTNPPGGPLDAQGSALRQMMLGQFSRWLRDRGENGHAAATEQMMETPDGQTPDFEEMRRRIEEENRGGGRGNGNGGQGRPRGPPSAGGMGHGCPTQ